MAGVVGGLPQQIEEDVQGELTLDPGLVVDLFLQPIWLCALQAPLNLERLLGRGSKTRLGAKEARVEVGTEDEDVSQTTNS